MEKNKKRNHEIIFLLVLVFMLLVLAAQAKDVLTPADLLKIQSCTSAEISPDGKYIAYTVSVPRDASETPGSSYNELYVIAVDAKETVPFVTGKVNVSSPQWSPDGKYIGFITRRGEGAKSQVWMMPLHGGEARPATSFENGVITYRWHPGGKKIAFTAMEEQTQKEKDLAKKGYGFIYYEENLRHRNLYLADILKNGKPVETIQITEGITVWDFEFNVDGKRIAASISPVNLIDQRYMFRKIYVIDPETKEINQVSQNPGKLGNYAFSPDGKFLAYVAALTREDHQVSQVYVVPVVGGEEKNLTIPDFKGHVTWAGWMDNQTLIYRSGEGVWSTFSTVSKGGGERKIIFDSKKEKVILGEPTKSSDNKIMAMIGGTAQIPGDVFIWQPGKTPLKKTDVNPDLKNAALGEQEVIHYNARDGQEIEGLLMLPVGYKEGKQYPLIVYVHGGPEHHHYNNWLSGYSTPGQVMAGKGYAVFYPNYRASTGYGVAFSMAGYGDPGGIEFDDIADGIDFLVQEGIADKERVGLAGGSYGGYASAWFASYYTKYVRAVCMFVGISDLISKRGTTDISYEELYVHSGKKLEEMWDISLQRSPIYWAHQSITATLIYGGAADTRVNPSQSLEFFYRLKMNNHPAVRLVQYPGEGHGNRNQPGRIDVLYRQIGWLDWYVLEKKPLDGPMPPLDISESYGINQN